jgi:hypothetical protein
MCFRADDSLKTVARSRLVQAADDCTSRQLHGLAIYVQQHPLSWWRIRP